MKCLGLLNIFPRVVFLSGSAIIADVSGSKTSESNPGKDSETTIFLGLGLGLADLIRCGDIPDSAEADLSSRINVFGL